MENGFYCRICCTLVITDRRGRCFLLACVILFTWGGGGIMSLPIWVPCSFWGQGSKQTLLIGRPPVGRPPPTPVGRPLQKTDPLVGRPAGFWHIVADTAAVGTHPFGMHYCCKYILNWPPKFRSMVVMMRNVEWTLLNISIIKCYLVMEWYTWPELPGRRILGTSSITSFDVPYS